MADAQNGPDLHPITQDPYRYAEVRGRVVETERGQEARDQIDESSQEYDGKPYPAENIRSERVTVWIEPERQTIAGWAGRPRGSPAPS